MALLKFALALVAALAVVTEGADLLKYSQKESDAAMPSLKPIMTIHYDLDGGTPISEGFMVINVLGGNFDGPNMKGKALRSGADWLRIRSTDGYGKLDVRAVLQTDDETPANIYLTYTGHVDFNGGLPHLLGTEPPSEYGDDHFTISGWFETSDPRYDYLNRVITVGTGRLGPGYVEYQFYEVDSMKPVDKSEL